MRRRDTDVRVGRSRHLIDVENLAEESWVSAEVARAAIDGFLGRAGSLGCDVWVVSARRSQSRQLARSASRVVPTHRTGILDLRDGLGVDRETDGRPVGGRR